MPGAIDIVINLHTPPEVLPLKPKWRREFIGDKMGADAFSAVAPANKAGSGPPSFQR